MKRLKCAVIGVGYLGRFHGQKYQHLDDVDLVAVCDSNEQVVKNIAEELGVPPITDYRSLLDRVDAVSIAATTKQHYTIAKACLLHGIHVLVEKPMTETAEEAEELILLAKQNNCKLQVGHLERFNAARLALDPYLDHPLFIESQRLAPFKPRGADVNVILDIMIHDIDLIQTMVKSPIVSVEAYGAPVLSSAFDIANARLVFANHCVANINASRVSFKTERKTRIFQKNSYLSIDYQRKQFAVFTKGLEEMFPGIPNVNQNQFTFDNGDALLAEIKSFIHCIQEDTPPLVSGEDGRDALITATKITHSITDKLKQHDAII